MKALYHHDIGPDGEPLDMGQRRPRYDERTLDERVEAAIAARLEALGELADAEDEREIRFEERRKMRRVVPITTSPIRLRSRYR